MRNPHDDWPDGGEGAATGGRKQEEAKRSLPPDSTELTAVAGSADPVEEGEMERVAVYQDDEQLIQSPSEIGEIF